MPASRLGFIATVGSSPILARIVSKLRDSGFTVNPLPADPLPAPSDAWPIGVDAILLDAGAPACNPALDWWKAARRHKAPLLICAESLTDRRLSDWLAAGVWDCFDERTPLPLVIQRIRQAVQASRQSVAAALRSAFVAGLSISAPARLAVMERVGLHFVFRIINHAFAKDFGRSPEELVDTPLDALGLTEAQTADLSVWQRWCKEALRLGRGVSFIHQSLRSSRWFSATFEPLRPHGFAADAVSIYVEDISDQQAAKLRSVESEERFYRVFQVIPVATSIQTIPDDRYLDINAAFTKLFGYTRAEAIGRTALELGLWERPEQRERYYRELEAQGQVIDFQITYRVRDGRQGEALLSSVTLVIGDLPCQLTLIQDITEAKQLTERLRQREEWFHAILNATSDGIIVEDDQRIVYANQAVARLSGIESPEALIGQDFSLVCAPHEEGRLRGYTQRRMRGEPAPTTYEFVARRADGGTLEVENSVSEFFSGGRKYLIAVMRDVSERKRLQATLQQAQKMEAVGRLAGGVAHDFNNLLNGILGFSRLARRKFGAAADPALDDYLKFIESSAERAARLVSKLLAFGQQKEAARQPVDLNAAVQDGLYLIRGLLPSNIQVVTDLAAELPTFEGDPDQIQQIVINLCLNARDAMPSGGTITLTTRAEFFPVKRDGRTLSGQLGGRCVCLTVADTGIGMDQPTRQHIFDPFFTTKDMGDGAGLGLSVVHGIVTVHGGTVAVESAPGQGARFEIRFPARRLTSTGEYPSLDASSPLPSDGSGAPLSLESASDLILVAEDDAMIAQLFTEILQEAGHNVVVATDGQRGVELFTERPDAFKLVILDALLPKLDGLACLQAIRRQRPEAPVLVASGYGEEAISGELSAQATVFLQKPFTPEVLLSAVSRALGTASVP